LLPRRKDSVLRAPHNQFVWLPLQTDIMKSQHSGCHRRFLMMVPTEGGFCIMPPHTIVAATRILHDGAHIGILDCGCNKKILHKKGISFVATTTDSVLRPPHVKCFMWPPDKLSSGFSIVAPTWGFSIMSSHYVLIIYDSTQIQIFYGGW
jgi:hypothetical protein